MFAIFLCLQKSLCSRFLLFCLKTTPDLTSPTVSTHPPLCSFCPFKVVSTVDHANLLVYADGIDGISLALIFLSNCYAFMIQKTIAEFALVWIPQFKLRS